MTLKNMILIAVLTAASFAHAEDDLLNILDGKAAPAQGSAVATTPLRRLLGKPTAEQNIFFQHIENQDYERALFQWSSAFENTHFAKSENGRALRAYLLFQTGLTVTGLEDLLQIEQVSKIDPFIIQLIRQAVPDTHPAWNALWVQKWNPRWTEVLGVNTEIRVRSRQLNGFEDGEAVRELISRSKAGTRERGLLGWQLILSLLEKDTGKAAQALAVLMKEPNNPISEDLMTMTAARLLFQNGYMDAAIKYYSKIPKKSDYWFEAQEEMGWAYLRKGQPQETLAVTKTLTQPYFAAMTGPEASFLRALAQLKVCDYVGVAQTLIRFRADFRDRTARLLEISKNADQPEVRDLFKKRLEGRIKFAEMGPSMKSLPRWAPRDQLLGSLIVFENALAQEAERAGTLYARSMSGGSDRVGFQGDMEALKNKIQIRRKSADVQALKRVQDLAAAEVKETQEILSRLHIVEAEMLQQGTMADRVAAAKSGKKSVLKGMKDEPKAYQVRFPAESEIWFDELSNFNVNLKGGCEAEKRRE